METRKRIRIGAGVTVAVLLVINIIIIFYLLNLRSKASKLNDIEIIKLYWIETMKVYLKETVYPSSAHGGFQVAMFKKNPEGYINPRVKAFFEVKDDDGPLEVLREIAQILIDYTKNKEDDYKNCVANFIKAVNNKVIEKKITFTEAVSPKTRSKWLTYSCFLNLYEYSVEAGPLDNVDSSNSICHSLIVKMIPKLNFFFIKIDGPALMINTSRLLTNYLYDETKFSKDMTDKEALKPLLEEFKFLSLPVKFYKALGFYE